MKIIIDPGHGGSDPGAIAFGTMEKTLNLSFATILSKKLEDMNISVDKSLINDIYYDSTQLTNLIKKSGAALCISCHNNSANGSARGSEVIHSIHTSNKLASYILEEIKKTGFPVRKAYSRESTDASNRGQDYYYVIRLTYPQVETIIIEFGFIDNAEDFKLLNDPVWQNKLASAAAEGIRKYLPTDATVKTNILGKAVLQPQQLKKALKYVNPSWNDSIVDLYYSFGTLYGVKPDLAFLQAIHETDWFRFTGVVKPTQNNFAGLGATGGENPGESFPTKEAGVEAHIQHLYAYCSKSPLPTGRKLVDTRFSYVQRGIAPNWEDLNGRWAVPGTQYGQNIVKLQKTVSEKYPAEPDSSDPSPSDPSTTHWAKPDNDELLQSGLLNTDHSSTLSNPASEGMVIALINRLRKEMIKNE